MTPFRDRPLIGIVPTRLPAQFDDGINHYAIAVERAGGRPYTLPITDDVAAYESIFPRLDAFLLTGGKDIDPVRYGNTNIDPTVTDYLPGREELEHLILSYCDEFDVPLLGICRGMQMINAFYGGTLYLDLQNDTSTAILHRNHFQPLPFTEPYHKVSIKKNSRLSFILQAVEADVNSMHHQGVKRLAPTLRATAFDDQGLIEAVEHSARTFLIGVQWHPEFLGEQRSMNRIFESLIDAARNESSLKNNKRSRILIDRIYSGTVWPQVSFIPVPQLEKVHALFN